MALPYPQREMGSRIVDFSTHEPLMTTPTAKFPTILTEITIDHGPEELLVPLFLRLEHAVRQLGLRLSFGSLISLSAINAANRASWMPLFPVYRPDYWPHTPSDAFVLLAS